VNRVLAPPSALLACAGDDGRAGLAAHLHRLEAELVSREVWRSREALEARVDPDFVEFASGGRVFDRSALVEGLVGAVPSPWGMDFTVRALAPEVALVTIAP
jgi:hypothetical protein